MPTANSLTVQPSYRKLKLIRSQQAYEDARVTRRVANMLSAGADHFSRDREACESYLAATSTLLDLAARIEARAARLQREAGYAAIR